jgi:hypothetical protein
MIECFRVKFFPKSVEVHLVQQDDFVPDWNMSYDEFDTWTKGIEVSRWFDESMDLMVGKFCAEVVQQ